MPPLASVPASGTPFWVPQQQVKRAYLIKLRYLKKVASTDGTTGMGLDGYATKYWLGLGVTDLDTESVQEVFMQAASVFNR